MAVKATLVSIQTFCHASKQQLGILLLFCATPPLLNIHDSPLVVPLKFMPSYLRNQSGKILNFKAQPLPSLNTARTIVLWTTVQKLLYIVHLCSMLPLSAEISYVIHSCYFLHMWSTFVYTTLNNVENFISCVQLLVLISINKVIMVKFGFYSVADQLIIFLSFFWSGTFSLVGLWKEWEYLWHWKKGGNCSGFFSCRPNKKGKMTIIFLKSASSIMSLLFYVGFTRLTRSFKSD